ncbi:MAG: glycosyltransferase family 4 protein [Candidatus Moranbacteria bacterium]|nr:glycosyltransferase family 4 protein [Candidatus Moranbacteria bacterium]NTW45746.1 glycosyltransferase family 4 protein [Candidatus Moranbacteria bacterium]
MNRLLLIKIGKAWQTLRREGVVRGMKRIVPAGLALFGHVRPADVLFVTGGVGDSARYRTRHVGEGLLRNGISSSVTVQDNPLLASYADKFSVFVLHRVLFTPSVAKLVGRVKAQGKAIVFDTDDLVFDPKYLEHMDYWRVMNALERKLYEHGVGGEILADPYVTVATASTSFIADKLREYGKTVYVVPNRLPDSDLEVIGTLLPERRARIGAARKTDTVTLSYFSGSLGHDKDFATVTEPLLSLLSRYPQLRLLLVGPLSIDPRFDAFSDRIERMHYVPREKHFGNIARSDIVIAPLEIGNPFCEGKSELKFFEAGALEVPIVAAATRPFREAITDGTDGFVASTAGEWEAKLESLIVDPELRKRIGERARETALSKYVTRAADDAVYVSYLRESIDRVRKMSS